MLNRKPICINYFCVTIDLTLYHAYGIPDIAKREERASLLTLKILGNDIPNLTAARKCGVFSTEKHPDKFILITNISFI